jgi:hypothetical protein
MFETITQFYNFYFGDTDNKIFFFVIFFIGLTFGWFFRKGSIFWIIVAIVIFLPVIKFIMQINHWTFTLPFCLGFLVHGWKPIYKKFKE